MAWRILRPFLKKPASEAFDLPLPDPDLLSPVTAPYALLPTVVVEVRKFENIVIQRPAMTDLGGERENLSGVDLP